MDRLFYSLVVGVVGFSCLGIASTADAANKKRKLLPGVPLYTVERLLRDCGNFWCGRFDRSVPSACFAGSGTSIEKYYFSNPIYGAGTCANGERVVRFDPKYGRRR
jgi:hypothetical protein